MPADIQAIQTKLRALAGVTPDMVQNPTPTPQSQKKTEMTIEHIKAMKYEQVKAIEKKASDWLRDHKHLKETDPNLWTKAMTKYKLIVRIMDIKYPYK
jgi:hypothetical protein